MMKHFGKRLKFEESKQSKSKREKEIFCAVITNLEKIWERSNTLFNDFGVGLIKYEDIHFSVIDDLLLLKYGPLKTEIIGWYIYERINPDGTINKLIMESVDGTDEEEFTLKTPIDLWNFIRKIK